MAPAARTVGPDQGGNPVTTNDEATRRLQVREGSREAALQEVVSGAPTLPRASLTDSATVTPEMAIATTRTERGVEGGEEGGMLGRGGMTETVRVGVGEGVLRELETPPPSPRMVSFIGWYVYTI